MTTKTLDCSDLDQHMGKAIAPAKMKEPLHNNDIRRWVQAMHYPNLLHYDHDFAAEGRYGKLVAPQSFAVACDDGHGAAPACGTTSSSTLPARYNSWNTTDWAERGNEHMTFLTRPAASSLASPRRPAPALLLTTTESSAPHSACQAACSW